VLATVIRFGLLIGLMYGYLITLGVFLHQPQPGWVTQDVQLGPVYNNATDDSPLALWATDLEFIDVNGHYRSVQGVEVGDVPIVTSCQVTDVPAPLRSTTTTSTFLPATSTTTTAPVAPPATDSTGKLLNTTQVCTNAITITYDPANPTVVQVVGGKDMEVVAFGLLSIWAVIGIGVLVLLKAIFGSYHPDNKGSLAAAIVWAVLGIACLVPGPFIVKEQPALAALLMWPMIFCMFVASSRARGWWHHKQLEAGNVPDTPDPREERRQHLADLMAARVGAAQGAAPGGGGAGAVAGGEAPPPSWPTPPSAYPQAPAPAPAPPAPPSPAPPPPPPPGTESF
jgi:hypothetical protein